MRKVIICLALILIACISLTGFAEAQLNMGISVGDNGLEGFYMAMGDYYHVPQREVIVIKERHIPDEEIPVVLYIAQMARVRPRTIIDMRLNRRTWMDITLHFGLSPQVYYVPVVVEHGPPYGRAYGHFKKKPRKEWNKIVLRDDDVVNLVNLKFTSEHYRYAPDDVIKMREEGRGFVEINHKLKKGNKVQKGNINGRRDKSRRKGKGKA